MPQAVFLRAVQAADTTLSVAATHHGVFLNAMKDPAMTQAINWFEIPVTDLDRAQNFYESMLDRTLRRQNFGGAVLAVFPYAQPATGGALLAASDACAPSGSGVRIYLDCMPSLDAALARAEGAGGQIVEPKSALPADMGFVAQVRDTEGNLIGLHALA